MAVRVVRVFGVSRGVQYPDKEPQMGVQVALQPFKA